MTFFSSSLITVQISGCLMGVSWSMLNRIFGILPTLIILNRAGCNLATAMTTTRCARIDDPTAKRTLLAFVAQERNDEPTNRAKNNAPTQSVNNPPTASANQCTNQAANYHPNKQVNEELHYIKIVAHSFCGLV